MLRFWIECTRFETGKPYFVNFFLVGGMYRDGDHTILEFVGSGSQQVAIRETPQDQRHGMQSHCGCKRCRLPPVC
jgi:hypothetical protein